MEMEEMQKIVDDYICQFKVGYFSPLALMARVTEEVGELAREINHYYGEKQKKSSEEKKEIAKKMIQKGMSLKEIEELTGLTEEELKNI